MKNCFVKITVGFALVFLIGYCAVDFLATGTVSLLSAFTTSVSAATAFGWLYAKKLWRINPFEKTPRLLRKYRCTLEYSHEKGTGKKTTNVDVNQTLFQIKLCFSTDEIFSYSRAAQFSETHGIVFLEYQYSTEPDALRMEKNPKQDGAAKLRVETSGLLNGADLLKGSYWTTSCTKGSIVFEQTGTG